jgi:dephospho-CoA kinase
VLIIGLSGKIGSGKSTAADYLEKTYGFEVLSTRRFLLAVLKSKGKEGSRSNLQQLGGELIRVAGGGGFVAMMLEFLPKENYVLDAIRHADAIQYLRATYGRSYLHIHLVPPDETRRSRVLDSGRSEQSLARLKEAETASTEKGNEAMRRAADFVIKNNGSATELHSDLDQICLKSGLKKSAKHLTRRHAA